MQRMLQIVQDLSKQLNDLIREILLAIKDDQRYDALRIMQWVSFSQRPMSTAELRFALEIGRNPEYKSQQEVTSSPTFISSDGQMEKAVRARTKGLVETKRHDAGSPSLEDGEGAPSDQVNFIHSSIKEFLLHHQGFAILDSSLGESPSVESQRHLATTCINYLGYTDFPELPIVTADAEPIAFQEATEIHRSLCDSFCFLGYCVDSVFGHIAEAKFSSGSTPSSQEAMSSMERSFNIWRRLADLNLVLKHIERRGSSTTFAHVATEFGMIDWVLALIRLGYNVNTIGSRYWTLLQSAAVMGHEELVDRLLENGADACIHGGGRFGNALAAAAFSGKTSIVRAILARGADVNAWRRGIWYCASDGCTAFRHQRRYCKCPVGGWSQRQRERRPVWRCFAGSCIRW